MSDIFKAVCIKKIVMNFINGKPCAEKDVAAWPLKVYEFILHDGNFIGKTENPDGNIDTDFIHEMPPKFFHTHFRILTDDERHFV